MQRPKMATMIFRICTLTLLICGSCVNEGGPISVSKWGGKCTIQIFSRNYLTGDIVFSWMIKEDDQSDEPMRKAVRPHFKPRSLKTTGSCGWLLCPKRPSRGHRRRQQCARIEGNTKFDHQPDWNWLNHQLKSVYRANRFERQMRPSSSPLYFAALPLTKAEASAAVVDEIEQPSAASTTTTLSSTSSLEATSQMEAAAPEYGLESQRKWQEDKNPGGSDGNHIGKEKQEHNYDDAFGGEFKDIIDAAVQVVASNISVVNGIVKSEHDDKNSAAPPNIIEVVDAMEEHLGEFQEDVVVVTAAARSSSYVTNDLGEEYHEAARDTDISESVGESQGLPGEEVKVAPISQRVVGESLVVSTSVPSSGMDTNGNEDFAATSSQQPPTTTTTKGFQGWRYRLQSILRQQRRKEGAERSTSRKLLPSSEPQKPASTPLAATSSRATHSDNQSGEEGGQQEGLDELQDAEAATSKELNKELSEEEEYLPLSYTLSTSNTAAAVVVTEEAYLESTTLQLDRGTLVAGEQPANQHSAASLSSWGQIMKGQKSSPITNLESPDGDELELEEEASWHLQNEWLLLISIGVIAAAILGTVVYTASKLAVAFQTAKAMQKQKLYRVQFIALEQYDDDDIADVGTDTYHHHK